jgi:hypothetical protein
VVPLLSLDGILRRTWEWLPQGVEQVGVRVVAGRPILDEQVEQLAIDYRTPKFFPARIEGEGYAQERKLSTDRFGLGVEFLRLNDAVGESVIGCDEPRSFNEMLADWSDPETGASNLLAKNPECLLGGSWNFGLIEADTKASLAWDFHGLAARGQLHRMVRALCAIDDALRRRFPNLSCFGALAFWSSWDVWKLRADFLGRLHSHLSETSDAPEAGRILRWVWHKADHLIWGAKSVWLLHEDSLRVLGAAGKVAALCSPNRKLDQNIASQSGNPSSEEPAVESGSVSGETRVHNKRKGDSSLLKGKIAVSFKTAEEYLGIGERQRQNLVKRQVLDVMGQGHNRKITTGSLRKYFGAENPK